MAKLHVTHHQRIEGEAHRWHVHLEGRDHPIVVELPDEERQRLDMSDDEVHALLPTALQRREEENRDDESQDVAWDAPVRVYQTHFMG
jgi:hypothetical protein